MRHEITAVARHSAAERGGLRAGDFLLSINGEPVVDEIDYQALIAVPLLHIELERGGKTERISVRKSEEEPLGLHFGQSMTLSPRTCRNQCAFCFIAQMPKGLRETLYVKDDDWRYSLMMGNFVTLTNVDENEFARILRRHASPLFISIHTTNPELRCSMMHNRFAGDIMRRLLALKAAGIRFHCQIVVCPGFNDGAELLRTLRDLKTLAPAAQTVAMVPVGLTRFREQLPKLTPFTREGAQALLAGIAPFQEECRQTIGTTFAFPSDEFFCLSGQPVPSEAWYEDFPQIENGVGLLRQLECELDEAAEFDELPAQQHTKTYVLPTGVSAAPHLERLTRRFAPQGVRVHVLAVKNHFFGETVTVAGLLTGGDVLAALTPAAIQDADEILLCTAMLRHEGDLFLDDMHIDTFRERAPLPVTLVAPDGQALYDALRQRDGEDDRL
ncbi:MAG: DUF512 domain-containing protein [Clostridia bacterium]